MAVNKWRIDEALTSFTRLNDIIDELTEEEVFACLDLESASRRRKSLINRLISRATRINEVRYSTSLKEKYHGTSTVQNPERS